MPSGISPGGRPIDESPLSASTSDNWVARNGGLPSYVRGVARGIARKHGGVVTSADIAEAKSRMEDWAATSKNPAVRAAAAAALAQWAALRAKAAVHDHSRTVDMGKSSLPFGGKKAAPFAKGGGRRKPKLSIKDRAKLALKEAKGNETSLAFAEIAPLVDLSYTGFGKLSGQLAAKGASNPGALAAWIGRRKYGKKKFVKAAASGVSLRPKKTAKK